jgi:ABC-2 type transport system permease protein
MKIIAVIKKALIMQLRDYWVLILTIASAPFFIFIYYAMTSGGSTTYSVNLFYADNQDTALYKTKLLNELNAVVYSNNQPSLKVVVTDDPLGSKKLIKDRNTDILLIIPEGFADSLISGRPPHFIAQGEASNPKYSLALIFSITAIENLSKQYAQAKPLYTFDEKFMGNSSAKSEFDIYAPGILIFSIIMILLTASLGIVRDIEDKTMLRLKLTRMTSFDYLFGNTFVQLIIGCISFVFTLWSAQMLGFTSQGSMFLAFLVCILSVLSIIAISLILVAFCKNTTSVLVLGNFPLFILMFFTGSMFPLPRHQLFTFAGHSIAFNDILPPTHSVIALNKIFTYGVNLSDISYELTMLFVLTIIYYALGVILFRKMHMK